MVDLMKDIDIVDVVEGRVKILPPDPVVYGQIRSNWDKVAKPLDSMGVFEEFTARIGAIQGQVSPAMDQCRILVMCADNGIVEEGISQSDQSVTALCAGDIAAGRSCLGVMAAREDIHILAVDMGMNTIGTIPLVRDLKVAPGTANFHKAPAMTRSQLLLAMQRGMDLVKESKQEGYTLLGMGEMGIGNTTTSSAVAAALLSLDPELVTGRGAGLSDAGLAHKKEIIGQALKTYRLYGADPLEILACVGGFDIAALVGMCMGGALYHVPIVLDGFISMAAALAACRIQPGVQDFLIPSHASKEPAVVMICKELGLRPVIDASMALGEGTGAVLMISLLKTTALVYMKSRSFDSAGIEQYERF